MLPVATVACAQMRAGPGHPEQFFASNGKRHCNVPWMIFDVFPSFPIASNIQVFVRTKQILWVWMCWIHSASIPSRHVVSIRVMEIFSAFEACDLKQPAGVLHCDYCHVCNCENMVNDGHVRVQIRLGSNPSCVIKFRAAKGHGRQT